MELLPAKRSRASLGDGPKRSGLSMYAQPPEAELSMSEVEECCYARLRLLRCIDHAKAKGTKGEALTKAIASAERDIVRQPLTTLSGAASGWSEEELVRDQCAHFMLRLAFCRSEELRRYFLANEHELFKHRFATETNVARFLRENGLGYEPISAVELAEIEPQLHKMKHAARRKDGAAALPRLEDHYKVPFEEVLDLVRGRRVFLRAGWAYVPHSDLISIVGGQFRARLSRALVEASRAWPALKEAEADRLTAFLEHCSTQYMVDEYAADKKGAAHEVSLAQLPTLAKRSYPLCMSHLNAKLQEASHLKHQGRIQLGLFLKGIGLSYEESLQFWRSLFTKAMPADKFDKEHRYNIRYNYGLEGQKKNYTPYSCAKVISFSPNQGEFHGCPFRTHSAEQLRAMLSRHSVKPADVSRIVLKATEHHYQVACGLYFEARHAGSALTETEMGGITHPNQYFDLSMKFYAELHAAQPGEAGAQPGSKPTESAGAVAAGAADAGAPVPMEVS